MKKFHIGDRVLYQKFNCEDKVEAVIVGKNDSSGTMNSNNLIIEDSDGNCWLRSPNELSHKKE